jgi:predicted Rossmann fold nucleotide-binding protein DprA/Smf involved in DNA uptake
MRENVLYLSENEFDEAFSALRALSRNRVIHCLGQVTLVAQSGYRTGGTWNGTEKNLRHGWSPVCCFADGSLAQRTLTDMGALAVDFTDLEDLPKLCLGNQTLFDE